MPAFAGEGFARLEKLVAISPTRVALELELRFDASPEAPTQAMALYFGNVASLTLLLTPGAAGGPGKTSVVEQTFGASAATVPHDLPVGLTPGGARRVRLAVDLAQRKLDVRVDGTPVLADMLTLTFPAADRVTALVGVVYANPTQPFTARIRNVLLDVK